MVAESHEDLQNSQLGQYSNGYNYVKLEYSPETFVKNDYLSSKNLHEWKDGLKDT